MIRENVEQQIHKYPSQSFARARLLAENYDENVSKRSEFLLIIIINHLNLKFENVVERKTQNG